MKTLVQSRGFKKLGLTFALSFFVFYNGGLKAVDFTEIARFNIAGTSINPDNPTPDDDIGVNAVALAFKANKLYLAGYNNSGVFQDTSIIEITNPTATGLVTPTYSSIFGTEFTPPGRGFTGLALNADGSKLAASFDDGVSNTDVITGPALVGLQVFDTTTNGQSWQFQERGGSGVDFDPGFPGGDPAQGSGVAYVESFGGGRRALLNANTGAEIWTPLDGMIWIPNGQPSGGNTRDIAFDYAAGDMYIRSGNDLYFSDRSGDNSTTQANNVLLVDHIDAPGVNYQHLAFMNTSSDGNLIIYNDRSFGGGGQDFFAVTKLVDTAGASQSANFTWLPNADSSPFLPASGAGWYDYDFDPVSQTLALLDPSSRFVHIFQVGSAGPNGDYDNDGDVDGNDFLIWQRGGSPNGTTPGDLAAWQDNYGTPLVASVASVPEPASAILALAAIASFSMRSRRRVII